jgi:hypothetical protein
VCEGVGNASVLRAAGCSPLVRDDPLTSHVIDPAGRSEALVGEGDVVPSCAGTS